MLVIHARIPIDPDTKENALEVIDELVEQSNREPGMIEYRAALDIQDDAVVQFVERYEDADAFESHLQTDHFQSFEAQLPKFLAGEPDVMRFEISDATELEL